jgi:hypothetical protein
MTDFCGNGSLFRAKHLFIAVMNVFFLGDFLALWRACQV